MIGDRNSRRDAPAKRKTTAKSDAISRRGAGLLLHVSSLPSPFGIGDLGPEAWRWVDQLADAGQSWWQILPLGPPGDGNSPYNCISAFAGNPLLISPDLLHREGLISAADRDAARLPDGRVRFAQVVRRKRTLLDIAWRNFRRSRFRRLAGALERFVAREASWLEDFVLFAVLKEEHPGESWTAWPRDLVLRRPDAIRREREARRERIERCRFIQFLFFHQLEELRKRSREREIRILGDLPMFVSAESTDAWAGPELFLLDRRRNPSVVAGVPPDYFSKTGQRWGNPLYRWTAHRDSGFAWWIRRVRATLAQADELRIDHFRGLDACWEIPCAHPTAERGRWSRAPGAALLETLQRELGSLPFVAEDLGLITPSVERLRDDFHLPGMRVLQFAFGGNGDNPFLPHNHPRNAVVYTGTHDNDTVVGWRSSLDRKQRSHLREYMGCNERDFAFGMIRMAWSSTADRAIAPAQDVLGLGSSARMNTPGRAEGNWGWRLTEPIPDRIWSRLADLTTLYGRS